MTDPLRRGHLAPDPRTLVAVFRETVAQVGDEPAVDATSRLSPRLRFGELSPAQVWTRIHAADLPPAARRNVAKFGSELGWRDFNAQLLFHHPELATENYRGEFDAFPWSVADPTELAAWQQGRTGIPMVDAGMRELWETGYMHNRVRMITGSFLVKNLLTDWREGEAWFWDCLADADGANNTAGWQWVAGSGADAAPYFRVFNPVLQGEKFDKQGEYVRTWCPELKKLPNKYIHKPWEADKATLKQAGIVLGEQYPEPLVDLKASRQRALDAFNEIKG